MKEISIEKIEIDGIEYSLFLNRKGIVAWERITTLQKQAKEMQKKYENISTDYEPIEVRDGDNPFELTEQENLDELETDTAKLRDIYVKFYWVALYEHHKLAISKVEELFKIAENEYGLEQIIELANQMIEDINSDKHGAKTKTKKLKALRPTK